MPPPRPPLLTLATLLALFFYWAAAASQAPLDSHAFRSLLLTERPELIWQGHYWSLLFNPLAHTLFFHFLFNAIWIWSLGRLIESLFGRQTLFALFFFAALAGSCADLATGFWPSFGATSIVYAMFGLLLGCRRDSPLIAAALPRRAMLLLFGWMPLLWILSVLRVWPVGPAGPLVGLGFGWLAARALIVPRRRALPAASLAMLTIALIAGALSPQWLPQWQVWHIVREVAAHQTDAAGRRIDALAQSDDPLVLNMLAWLMATAPLDELRNGARAVELAHRANEATQFQNPMLLDTLAAAHAELGEWTEAERYQQLALEMIKIEKAPLWVEPAELERTLRANLATITSHTRVRDAEYFQGLKFAPLPAATPTAALPQ